MITKVQSGTRKSWAVALGLAKGTFLFNQVKLPREGTRGSCRDREAVRIQGSRVVRRQLLKDCQNTDGFSERTYFITSSNSQ
jgi:hypothetical protein